MYYLQSRYYDPAICRFISADDYEYLGANCDLIGYNLYAYCSNNPISYIDPTGHAIWEAIIVGAIIGGIIGFVTSTLIQAGEANGDFKDVDYLESAFDGAVGAINGAIASTGISGAASIAIGAGVGGISSIVKDMLFSDGNISCKSAIKSAIIGGISGVISGAGANNSKDGAQITKYILSREILNRTIANGTKSAVSRQTQVMFSHARELIISGAKYVFSNIFSFFASEIP